MLQYFWPGKRAIKCGGIRSSRRKTKPTYKPEHTMKKLIPLIVCLAAVAAPGDLKQSITLSWTPSQTLEDIQASNIYCKTNVVSTNWTRIETVVGPGTNCVLQVSVLPSWGLGYRGPYYFTVTSSNFWGESVFSNVAWIPSAPSADKQLQVR